MLVTEHMGLLAGAPRGNRRLRDLVLELAASGKLVPQSEFDEPGSQLLAKIKALRAANPSRNGPDELVDDVQLAPLDLPSGWVPARLGEIVDIVRGITFPASEKTKAPGQGKIACLRTSNVQDGVEWHDILYVDEKFVGREDQLLRPADIVMSMANSRELVGKVALVTDMPVNRASFGGFLGVIRPLLVDPRFVMTLLRTPSSRRALMDGASQTTNIANISLAKLRPLPVAVPPLPEQHRIVSKVDELMALCDRLEARRQDAEAAHAQLVQVLLDSLTQARDADDFRASWQRLAGQFHHLFRTDQSIDRLKTALRRMATSGRLTCSTCDEPAAEGLIAELADHWRQRSARRLALSTVPQGEHRHSLPASWRWLRFGFVADTRLGKMLDAAKNSGSLKPYLRNTNVQWNRFELDDLKEMRLEDAELDQYKIRTGDLLICEGGEPGRCAVWRDESREIYFQKALHRVRPLSGISSDYLQLCLQVDAETGQLDRLFTGATIKHLTGEKLERYVLPVPPPAEQRQIIERLAALLALCDQLKARIAAGNAKHAQLAEALVAQAVTA